MFKFLPRGGTLEPPAMPLPRLAAASALALAALVAPADARIFSGDTRGASFPFIGKFAFGPRGGRVRVAAGSPTNVNFVAFDDSAWPAGCSDSRAREDTPLIAGVSSVDFSVGGSSRPFYWFMLFSSSDPARPTGSSCGDGVSTAYTVEATQADGSQLAYDEVGLPAVYGVFWVVSLAQLAFHCWRHYFRRPAFAPGLVRALTALLALHALSDVAHLIEWSEVARTGRGSAALAAIGGLLRLGAQAVMWAAAALAAVGFGITSAEA